MVSAAGAHRVRLRLRLDAVPQGGAVGVLRQPHPRPQLRRLRPRQRDGLALQRRRRRRKAPLPVCKHGMGGVSPTSQGVGRPRAVRAVRLGAAE